MKALFISLIVLFPIWAAAKTNVSKYDLQSAAKTENQSLKKEAPENKKYTIFVGIQDLYSTHDTNFKGVEVVENYHLSPKFLLGLGVEYSHCGYHFDNGFNLTNLRFVPVFIDSKMNLTHDKVFTPYLHLASGVSFANYNKQDALTLGPTSHISEEGLYLYSGAGITFKIKHLAMAYFDLGFKGYHMSFNDLDVNPHGLTFKLGIGI